VNLIPCTPGHLVHSTHFILSAHRMPPCPHATAHRTLTPLHTAAQSSRMLPPMLVEEDRSPAVKVGRRLRSEKRTPITAAGPPTLGGGSPALAEDADHRRCFARTRRTFCPWPPPARQRGVTPGFKTKPNAHSMCVQESSLHTYRIENKYRIINVTIYNIYY
jgi:hypothetical protein